MNPNDIKKVLRPFIKEIVKEVLLETNGLFSRIIKESVEALAGQRVVLTESTPTPEQPKPIPQIRRGSDLKEERKRLLDAIGADNYNGVDVFKGVKPMTESKNPSLADVPAAVPSQAANPLSGMDPSDPGIDISGIMGMAGAWKTLARGNKKK